MRTYSQQSGFTLIEMLVSLSLFTIIITITVGALLVLINGNRELVNSQTVMSTLAFSLDSMTREIRTGRAYFCGSANNKNNPVAGSNSRIFKEDNTNPPNSNQDHDNLGGRVNDCVNGMANNASFHGVSVIEGGDSITGPTRDRILYYYQVGDADTPGQLMRRVGNDPAESILSSSIDIVDANFYVSGSDRLIGGSDDTEQPTVTIVLEAADVNDPTNTITLQTTITQRELDI